MATTTTTAPIPATTIAALAAAVAAVVVAIAVGVAVSVGSALAAAVQSSDQANQVQGQVAQYLSSGGGGGGFFNTQTPVNDLTIPVLGNDQPDDGCKIFDCKKKNLLNIPYKLLILIFCIYC